MQPEVVAFFSALVLALVKIVQFWIVWETRDND